MIPGFLKQNAVIAAPQLLGWKLSHFSPEGETAGYIVEVEAYSMDDPASHSFRGPTPLTAPMFEDAGTIYVYFTYGMHYCMNIVTGSAGHGQGILIRALEPVTGEELMQARRGPVQRLQLTNGPGKLAQALGVDRSLSGMRLDDGPIKLDPGVAPGEVVQTTRIGITKAIDHPWRFYIKNNAYVSKK